MSLGARGPEIQPQGAAAAVPAHPMQQKALSAALNWRKSEIAIPQIGNLGEGCLARWACWDRGRSPSGWMLRPRAPGPMLTLTSH
eukprot:15482093-Alexandrium_andersonii.AAC.1